ncbi:MAG: caspase family protein [Magnetococcales bacterium]|nr:caspase family protein [Magnetococcales bacterium]
MNTATGVTLLTNGTEWIVKGTPTELNATLAGIKFMPNANWDQNFTIAVTVNDGMSPIVTGMKQVTVTPVNDPPLATNLSAPEELIEDAAPFTLNRIVITDVDSPVVTATLTLGNRAAGGLSTATSHGVTATFDGVVWRASGAVDDVNTLLAGVVFSPGANWDQNVTITTTVSDGVNLPLTGSKWVTVNPVNDPPVDLILSANTIAENTDSSVGSLIGIFSTTEVDTVEQVTYSLVGGADEKRFLLGGTSNDQLILKNEKIDYESQSSYAVTVRVMDSGGLSLDKSFLIQVLDVNEAPVDLRLEAVPLTENLDTSAGYSVGRLVATDVDVGDPMHYSVIGGRDGAKFSIGGDRLLLSDGKLDYERQSGYEVTVRVMDLAGAYRDETFLVEVINVNEQVVVLPVTTPVTAGNGVIEKEPVAVTQVVLSPPSPSPSPILPVPVEVTPVSSEPAPSPSEVVQSYQTSPDPVSKAVGGVLERVGHGENIGQAELIATMEKNGAQPEQVMEALKAFVLVQKEARTELFSGALQELNQQNWGNVFDDELDQPRRVIPDWFPQLSGERIALLIGINRYQEPIPSLNTPLNDVNVIGAILQSRGYQVIILPDANYRTVIDSFRAVGEKIGEHQDLLVYYAGHGYMKEDTKTGYWLPSDAKPGSANKWISTRHLSDFLGKVKARHTMVVSDSCFSGSLTREYSLANESVGLTRKQIDSKRSVMMMSSGGEEPVLDGGGDGHSVFAFRLIQSLKEMESGKSGFDLFQNIRSAVKERSPQTPQYGAMLSAGHEPGGEFFFK